MRLSLRSFPGVCAVWLIGMTLLARTALAASGYQVDVWRADDGLPQGTVTSIVQTRDGYLWLGTQYGLVRFDGVNFKIFNENNTPAIKSKIATNAARPIPLSMAAALSLEVRTVRSPATVVSSNLRSGVGDSIIRYR